MKNSILSRWGEERLSSTVFIRLLTILLVMAFSATTSRANESSLPKEMSENLILYYSFDSDPSKKVMDESGQKNDGKPVNVEWVNEGHQGGAARFGLSKSYITVKNRDELNPPTLTLSAWINTSFSDRAWRRIFDKEHTIGYMLCMGGDYNGKSWRGQVGVEVGKAEPYSGIKVTDGLWHHIVGTYDGEKAIIFVDGWPRKERRWVGKPEITDYDLTIGANHSNPDPEGQSVDIDDSFNGLMDDVMMFNRALSEDEVQTLFKAQGGTLGAKPTLNKPVPVAPAPASPKKEKNSDSNQDQQYQEQLKKLKSLYEDGLISKEIYEEKQKELVNSLLSGVTGSPLDAQGHVDLKDGLVLHLGFNEDASTAADDSGHENHGKVKGAKWIKEGRIGGAYHFDQKKKNNAIIVKDSDSLDCTSVTVAAWIKTDDVGSGWTRIINKNYEKGYCLLMGGPLWDAKENADRWFGKSLLEFSENRWIGTKRIVADGEWHHLIASYGDGMTRIYVDGKLDGEQKVKNEKPIQMNDIDLVIGNKEPQEKKDPLTKAFDGLIDEVRVYNRALSQDEVTALFELKE